MCVLKRRIQNMEPCQTSKMKLFAIIVNDWKLFDWVLNTSDFYWKHSWSYRKIIQEVNPMLANVHFNIHFIILLCALVMMLTMMIRKTYFMSFVKGIPSLIFWWSVNLLSFLFPMFILLIGIPSSSERLRKTLVLHIC